MENKNILLEKVIKERWVSRNKEGKPYAGITFTDGSSVELLESEILQAVEDGRSSKENTESLYIAFFPFHIDT